MTTTIRQRLTAITEAISAQIHEDLAQYDSESRYPQSDPDRMDDRLKHFRNRVALLRELRQRVEDAMVGIDP
jgi:hypothetical protein